MRAIDGDRLKRKAQKVATEAWKMKLTAKVETTLNQFIDWIDEQPTIEPQRTGRWLPDNNSVYEMRFVCSECKTSEIVPTIGFTKYKPIWDFCPNCGAEMTEKSEDIPMEYFESGGR